MAGEGWDLTPSRYQPLSGLEVAQDGTAYDVAAWRRTFVPSPHYRIHIGQGFSTHMNGESLAMDQELILVMNTGAISPHVAFDVSAKFDFNFDILEEATYTGGTAGPAYNRNRNSSNVASASILTGATVTGEGTIISDDVVSDGQKLGGNVDFDQEWIFKSQTTYIMRLISKANSNKAHINLMWYEPS